MSETDFREHAGAARRIIQQSDFSKRSRALLHEIVYWSFERGREWAMFETLEDLCALTGLHKPDVSNALGALQRSGMIHLKTSRGHRARPCLMIRFLPHGALAPAPSVIDEAAAAAVRAKLEQLNSLPIGYEPGGQKPLPLPLDPAAAVENELAENSRAAARSVSGSLTRMVSESLTRNALPAPPARVARTRARAGHEHDKPGNARHEHEHATNVGRKEDPKELTPAQRDLLDQIEELTAAERPEQFRTTWIRRIRDHEIPVFKSIGQVRMMRNQGEIAKTAGGALNYYFKLFRDGRPAASVHG